MEQAFVRVHGDLAQGQMPTENYIKKEGELLSFCLMFFLLSQLCHHMDKRKERQEGDFHLMTPERLGQTTLDVTPHTYTSLKHFSYGKKT